MDMDIDGDEADAIPLSKVKVKVDHIMAQSYPEVMAYYRNCVATRHKKFTWTGPPVTIFPKSEPKDMDDLVGRTGQSASALSSMLLMLELEGLVESLAGNRFQRLPEAG